MFKYSSIDELAKVLDGSPVGMVFGNYDGYHLGHADLIEKLKSECLKNNLISVVVTLSPHPKLALNNEKNFLITTPHLKEYFLKKSGIDYLLELDFSNSLARISGKDFIKSLIKVINIKLIHLGHDFAIGSNRSYSSENLKDDLNGFAKILELDSFKVDMQVVSSSLIRNEIKNGNISIANKYLGHPFILSGSVFKGKQLGRTIGFPTVNLNLNQYQVIPKAGVYIGGVNLDKFYPAAINIGYNPTTDAHASKKLEIHLLNFKDEIYENELEVVIYERIRDEIKFESIDALKEQIKMDVEKTKKYFL